MNVPHAGGECRDYGTDIAGVDGFVECDVNSAVAAVAEIDLRLDGGLHDPSNGLRMIRHLEPDCVEVLLVQLLDSQLRELGLQQLRERADTPGNRRKALRPVIDRVQTRDVRE